MQNQSSVAVEPYATNGLPELQRVRSDTLVDVTVAYAIVKRIETAAAEAMADPAYAAACGIVPMVQTPLFGDPCRRSKRTEWLRGAVVALLAPGWRYEIVEGIDGSAHLMLLGYDPA